MNEKQNRQNKINCLKIEIINLFHQLEIQSYTPFQQAILKDRLGVNLDTIAKLEELKSDLVLKTEQMESEFKQLVEGLKTLHAKLKINESDTLEFYNSFNFSELRPHLLLEIKKEMKRVQMVFENSLNELIAQSREKLQFYWDKINYSQYDRNLFIDEINSNEMGKEMMLHMYEQEIDKNKKKKIYDDETDFSED